MEGTVNPTETESSSAVAPEISRSWLLISARRRADDFDASQSSRADQIILDLEDAVDPQYKSAARADVAGWLNAGGAAWVRINAHGSPFWADDIDELCTSKGLKGVMLAKTEGPDQVTETFDRLGGVLPVLALVESALGIEEATAIARAPGAFRLAFGSGDYRKDTGASADEIAMAYPRSRLVVASRVGGLPGPIDGPTVGSSHPVLRDQSERSVALGMTGKLCLAEDQLAVVNEAISPTASDVDWARGFLDDFAARGGVVRDGSDLPRLGRARKIENLAKAFGIEPDTAR